MPLKSLLPLPVRNLLRPAYQRMHRRWRESGWSSKPPAWEAAKSRAHQQKEFEPLLQMAHDEFGITQITSEISGLVARLRELAPKTIVEIGTHKGGNSFLFCHAVPSAELVVGVDLCVQNAEKLIHFVRPGQVYRALHGDSQTEAMKRRVMQKLGSRQVDFLFIDGDHSYAGVKADFELYSPLVRSGGLVALHDIVSDHRTRYGRETGCYAGEVHQYWAELKQRYRCEEFIDDPDQDGFGIGLVHIP